MFSPNFFGFSLIIILSLLYTITDPEMCDSSYQAVYYRILGLQVESFISDPALDWLQSKEVKFKRQY
jgi:hypothetical protein